MYRFRRFASIGCFPAIVLPPSSLHSARSVINLAYPLCKVYVTRMPTENQTKKTVRKNFVLSEREREQLTAIADDEGIPVSQMIRRMIREQYQKKFGILVECSNCTSKSSHMSLEVAFSAGWVKTENGWKCPCCSISG
jgi:mevalonate kinase